MPEKKLERNLYFMDKQGEPESDEIQDLIAEDMRDYQEEPIEGELEKSEEMQEFLAWVIPEMSQMLAQYEVDFLEPTAALVHCLPEDIYKTFRPTSNKDEYSVGFNGNQGVILNEKFFKQIDLAAAFSLVHELAHYYSFQKQYLVDDPPQHQLKRSGTIVVKGSPLKVNDQSSTARLIGLNEGLTQAVAIKFYQEVLRNHPKFITEVDELDKKLTPEEIEAGEIEIPGYRSYMFLELLIDDLIKKINEVDENHQDYRGTKDVFIKAYLNGRLTPVARMLRKIGKDCLLDLGEIGSTMEVDNMERLVKFRKKYGLERDYGAENVIKEHTKDLENN